MKITHLFLLVGIISSTVLPIIEQLNPQNSVLVFDLDDVIIRKSALHKPRLITGGIAQNPRNGYHYIQALRKVKAQYKKDADGIKEALYDTHGNQVMGLTFHFLYHGIRFKELAPYVAWIVNTMEHSRCFIKGTYNIILYLKKKGYSIAFATNKDRISYDLTAKSFGSKLTQLSDKVFVAHPGNKQETLDDIKQFAQSTDAPKSYRVLAEQALNAQETNSIIHAPSKKPNPEYFAHVSVTLGNSKNLVFIDDKKSNVDAFNDLQKTSESIMHGIHFINPIQLANELVKIGILSETKDYEFLEEIRNPGAINKAKRFFNKLYKKYQSIKQTQQA